MQPHDCFFTCEKIKSAFASERNDQNQFSYAFKSSNCPLYITRWENVAQKIKAACHLRKIIQIYFQKYKIRPFHIINK